jgi:hypothetical protein
MKKEFLMIIILLATVFLNAQDGSVSNIEGVRISSKSSGKYFKAGNSNEKSLTIPTTDVFYRLTDNGVDDKYPIVKNGMITWVQELTDGYNIMLFDGKQTKTIHSSSNSFKTTFFGGEPKLCYIFDGQFIIWMESRDPNSTVLKYVDVNNASVVNEFAIGSYYYTYSDSFFYYLTMNLTYEIHYINLQTQETGLITDLAGYDDIMGWIAAGAGGRVYFTTKTNLYMIKDGNITEIGSPVDSDFQVFAHDQYIYYRKWNKDANNQMISSSIHFFDGQVNTKLDERFEGQVDGQYGYFYKLSDVGSNYLHLFVHKETVGADTVFRYDINAGKKEPVITRDKCPFSLKNIEYDENWFASTYDSSYYLDGQAYAKRWIIFYNGKTMNRFHNNDVCKWHANTLAGEASLSQKIYALEAKATGYPDYTSEEDTEIVLFYLMNYQDGSGPTVITDTLNYDENLDMYLLYANEGGYCAGNNAFGDIAKANYFNSNKTNTTLTGLICDFAVAEGNATELEFAIWNMDKITGKPGKKIASFNYPFSSLKQDVIDVASTFIEPDQPVNIDGPFYAGIILPQNTGDTVALYQYDVTNGNAWEQFDDGSWYNFNDSLSWGDEVNLAIFPILSTKLQTSAPLKRIETEISAYPNPFSDQLNLKLPEKHCFYKVNVYNLNGKLILEKKVSSKDQLISVNTKSLSNGFYIINFLGKDENRNISLVKAE